MQDIGVAFAGEVPRFASGLALLIIGWLVGQRLTVSWNLRQKYKEIDLATARDFHALYGEFFAIWKLWDYYLRDAHVKAEGSRWDLLDRACTCEGNLESILVRLASERPLESDDIEVLGCFRQLYQKLRQCIRDNRELGWHSSEHPEYLQFKSLASKVSSLILMSSEQLPVRRASSDALIRITSNEWERSVQTMVMR